METETWVLNKRLTTTSVSVVVSFTSNNLPFNEITRLYQDDRMYINRLSYAGATVANAYSNGAWLNEAYRTITFDEPVTDTTLLAWLQANGTKQ